jgi:heterodisulfide reductase subunit C
VHSLSAPAGLIRGNLHPATAEEVTIIVEKEEEKKKKEEAKPAEKKEEKKEEDKEDKVMLWVQRREQCYLFGRCTAACPC